MRSWGRRSSSIRRALVELGSVRQKAGKLVHGWAAEGEFDPASCAATPSRWSGRRAPAPSASSPRSTAPSGSTPSWREREDQSRPGGLPRSALGTDDEPTTPTRLPPGEGPSGRPLPLSVRLLGAGVRGARSVSKATGIDRAVEAAAEEAMVAAVESEAVERAMARVLQGPVVEEAMNGALESDAVKHALVEALDSELVDEVWRRLLASDEAQRLVERIAEAPEIRAAISAQSIGLIEDVGHTIGNGTRRLDGGSSGSCAGSSSAAAAAEPTDRAGAVTRGARLRPRRADRQPRLLRPGRGRWR